MSDNFFPIVIDVENEDKPKIVYQPQGLPIGVSFKVLETLGDKPRSFQKYIRLALDYEVGIDKLRKVLQNGN